MIDPVTFQGPNGANRPVGTGPLTFAEWIQGDHFTLKKNRSYWQSGKPYVDGITIKIYNDAQAMVTQLQGGAVDAVIAPPITSVADLQNDPKYKVVLNKQTGASTLIAAQCKDPNAPAGNKLFRQAVNWATDRQRIVDTAYLGFGEVRDLPFPSNSPAYDETHNRHYTFNLDTAKSLLAQSGITDPTVDFMWSTAAPDVANIAQILQSDLAKIGITLNLRPTEPVAALSALFNSTFTGLFGGTILLGQLHPSVMNGSPYYSAGYNWVGFHSDDLARVDDAILHAADPAKAKAASNAWSDYVLDQSFAMPISAQYPHFLTTAKVNGMSFDVAGDWITTNDAWLSA
jgi:peptide/nickel transport system substrate-binding protein